HRLFRIGQYMTAIAWDPKSVPKKKEADVPEPPDETDDNQPSAKASGNAQLSGHLDAGTFITKFRNIVLRNEMNDDLVLLPGRLGQNADESEYEELLPVSSPRALWVSVKEDSHEDCRTTRGQGADHGSPARWRARERTIPEGQENA